MISNFQELCVVEVKEVANYREIFFMTYLPLNRKTLMGT
jgi:hypothetical protein